MMNLNLYQFDSNPYVKMKNFSILPLSDEGVNTYHGPTSHAHNYIPNQLR